MRASRLMLLPLLLSLDLPLRSQVVQALTIAISDPKPPQRRSVESVNVPSAPQGARTVQQKQAFGQSSKGKVQGSNRRRCKRKQDPQR